MVDGDLRRIFRENLTGWQWTSVESPTTGRGIPDAEFCAPPGIAGWIEFKLTAANAVAISAEQCLWHSRRAALGGRSYIAIRRHSRKSPRLPARDDLVIIPGRLASQLRILGVAPFLSSNFPQFFDPRFGPKKWDWNAVREYLLAPNYT